MVVLVHVFVAAAYIHGHAVRVLTQNYTRGLGGTSECWLQGADFHHSSGRTDFGSSLPSRVLTCNGKFVDLADWSDSIQIQEKATIFLMKHFGLRLGLIAESIEAFWWISKNGNFQKGWTIDYCWLDFEHAANCKPCSRESAEAFSKMNGAPDQTRIGWVCGILNCNG